MLGCYFTPANIAEKMFEVCEPYLTNRHQSLLDPFAGTGDLAISFIEKMDLKKIHLNDVNSFVVSQLRDIFDDTLNVKITNVDWMTYNSESTYDLIVSDPPYGSRGFNVNTHKTMEKIHKSLKPGGLVCILLPDELFFNHRYEDIFNGFDKLSITSVKYEQSGFNFSIGVFQKLTQTKRKLDFEHAVSTSSRRKVDSHSDITSFVDVDNIDTSEDDFISHNVPRVQHTSIHLKDICQIYKGKRMLIGGKYIIVKMVGNPFNNLKYIDEPFYQLSQNEYAINANSENSFYSTLNVYNYLLKNKSDLLDKMYKGKAQLRISKEDLSNIVIN